MSTHVELLALLLMVASACGSVKPIREAMVSPCLGPDEHLFGAAELVKIRQLRERGDSLADVAAAVGGSRADVKAVDRWLRSRGDVPGSGLCARPASRPGAVAGSGREVRVNSGRQARQQQGRE